MKPIILPENLWQTNDVEIELLGRMIGGIPQNREMIEGWIRANMKKLNEEQRARIADATEAELPDIEDEIAKSMWTVFKQDDKGIYYETRCMKSAIKEASNILRKMLIAVDKKTPAGTDADGEPAPEPPAAEAPSGKKPKKPKKPSTVSKFECLRSKIAERVYIEGYDYDKIRFYRDGQQLVKSDGDEERPIHVNGPQGKQNALKRYDFVEPGATLKFRLRVLRDGLVNEGLLLTLLDYMGHNGIGADRSQGFGTFKLKSLVMGK